MPTRTADAVWNGTLTEGKGTLKSQSGAINGAYDWRGRTGEGAGTNPEELIAAAHAGCFSMALSHILTGAGKPPTAIRTTAKVQFDKQGDGFAITGIALTTEAEVPGLDDAGFQQHAAAAKAGCPVSKALSAVPITLAATLKK
ncbi:MAG: peroxiredoxin [Phycisphaerales bacterium]|nr:peroxiredoxin [Phycisphaerales bacterium]